MNKVRECWQQGRSALAGWLQLPGTLHAEALSQLAYDAVVIDLQHGAIDMASVAPMLLAIEHGGAEPFVRMQVNDAADAMRLLDIGAYGLIAPMVNDAAEAAAFAAALHYPPRGNRSFGPRRPVLRYGGDYAAMAGSTVVGLAMIETRRAVENLDRILEVDTLDGVFIGPTDLALDMGAGPEVESGHSEVVETIALIRNKAHAAGKRVGIFCASGAAARMRLKEKFDFVTAVPDLTVLIAGMRAVITETRS